MKSGGYITVTSTGVKATLNQIFLSVSMFSIFTIFQDSETEYVAMCTAYLCKSDLDEEDFRNDADALAALSEDHATAAEAWQSWPTGAEAAMFVVLLGYLATVLLGLQGYMLQDDGVSESVVFICARTFVLLMFWACVFLIACRKGHKWNRLQYLLRSSHAVTVFLYITCYFIVGMIFPELEAPVSSRLSVAFTTSGFLLWLVADAFPRLSRIARSALTIFTVFRCLYGIYLAVFVWKHDPEVTDLNGPLVAGTLTKLWLYRLCFTNLLLLMSGSLYTLVVDWREGKFMTVVSGYVLREDVLAMESVTDLVGGDADLGKS